MTQTVSITNLAPLALPRASRNVRRAHTLAEMMVAITISTALVLGLVSVLTLSLKTLKLHDGPAARTTEASQLLSEMASDLDLATSVTERTSTSISMECPDRDGDHLPELIQYRFLPEQSIINRKIVFSSNPSPAQPAVIARDVSQFKFDYRSETEGEPPVAPDLVSDERLLISHDDHPPSTKRTNSKVLMLRSGWSLTTQERARKALFESMGFYVYTIRQSSHQFVYNWLVPRFDVVYVPSQVDASNLADRLKTAEIGIVSENTGLSETFGFGLADGNYQSLSLLALSEPHHFLAAANLIGGLDLFADQQSVDALSSNAAELAPDLKTIGRWKSKPAFSYLNQHDELYMGTPGAAGEFGYHEVFPLRTTALNKLHFATQLPLSTGVKVSSVSAYSQALANSNVRYAIYSDKDGEPDKRLAQTDVVNYRTEVSASWKTIPLTRETNLLPGNYWLAIGTQSNMVFPYALHGGKARAANSGTDPVDGMMANWVGSLPLEFNTLKFSIYANYTETDFAAGRRVQLPWGEDSFDIRSLNVHGKQLLENAIEWAADNTPAEEADELVINDVNFVSQRFLPSLPANATAWEITRVVASIKPNEDDSAGKLKFGLHKAAGAQNPGPVLQETAWISTDQISEFGYQWFEIPFEQTGKLDPDQPLALVIKGNSSQADAMLKIDLAADLMTSQTHLLKSNDSGSSWSFTAQAADLRCYVYGRVYTEGE